MLVTFIRISQFFKREIIYVFSETNSNTDADLTNVEYILACPQVKENWLSCSETLSKLCCSKKMYYLLDN
jgi:hypothetical protein